MKQHSTVGPLYPLPEKLWTWKANYNRDSDQETDSQ